MTAGAVLGDSARLLIHRPWLVLLAAVVVVPLDVLDQLIDSWWLAPFLWLGYPIAQGAVAAAALGLLAGSQADVPGTFRLAIRRSPVLLVASLVSTLGVVLGTFLLIVPGLVLLARWAVFVPVLINERVVGLGLGRSWQLVKGRSWVAFWATLVPALVFAAFVVTAFLFHGSAWHAVWITVDPLLLTYETLIAVVLYRWLAGSAIADDAVLGPDIDPHSPAYDLRGELGPRPYG